MTREEAFSKISPILSKLARDAGAGEVVIGLDTSLIDDLGFESLTFVDLTLSLEAALQLPEFPMQRWADQELPLTGRRFMVASLVDACTQVLNEGALRD